MKYNHIQRFLSAALLLAFTAPSSLTASAYDTVSSAPYTSSMVLSGDVKLTPKNEKITLSLRDSDVKQVLRMFADKAGLNVVFHSSVDGKVTLDLVDMPINDAFNLVLQVAGLNYYTQNNTMVVIAKDNADNASFSKQEMMVFPVKYVSASKIADFLNKNVFGMKKAGLSSVDAATVNTAIGPAGSPVFVRRQRPVALVENPAWRSRSKQFDLPLPAWNSGGSVSRSPLFSKPSW